MYVCMCVLRHVHMYVRIDVYDGIITMQWYVCMHAWRAAPCLYVCMPIDVCDGDTQWYVCIDACAHCAMSICMYALMYAIALSLRSAAYVCMHARVAPCVYVCMHWWAMALSLCSDMYVCMHARVAPCVYACMHWCAMVLSLCTDRYVCMHARVAPCLYVCTY
jgi:Fe-S-cluster-containing hydrogenase component 2